MRLITQALEFGHNPGTRRWVGRLFPYADRWWFPPLTAALSAAATLSLTVPVGPMLMALVALNPRRWRAVVVWTVLGKGLKYSLVGAVTARTTSGPQGSVEPSQNRHASWR